MFNGILLNIGQLNGVKIKNNGKENNNSNSWSIWIWKDNSFFISVWKVWNTLCVFIYDKTHAGWGDEWCRTHICHRR